MALSKHNDTEAREQTAFEHLVKGSTTIYGGSLVVAAADGFAKPGLTATGLVVLGMASQTVVNAGADGAAKVLVEGPVAPNGKRRLFRFKNATAGDALTQAEIGRDAYILDDETFTKTATGRSVGGKLREIEKDAAGTATGYVWIELPL